jgi:hypothetical protein
VSRFSGASRCSLPCTLISTLFEAIATCTPTAPETSSRAWLATLLRPFALTATWPPVARVSEPPSKPTSPPETISTRDRSRRSSMRARLSNTPGVTGTVMRARSCFADSAIKASRWLSSALPALSSSTMALVACAPMVTLPSASLAEFSRWMLPRALTVVVASATPSCTTWRPASVMSPSGACSRPVLLTAPAVLSALNCGETSLPRVVA